MRLRRAGRDIVTQGGQQAAVRLARSVGDTAQRTNVIDHVGRDAAGERRGIVQPIKIRRAGMHRGIGGFIQREKFRRAVDRRKTPASHKTRDADALGHVLAVVPGKKIVACVGRRILPDGDCAFAG